MPIVLFTLIGPVGPKAIPTTSKKWWNIAIVDAGGALGGAASGAGLGALAGLGIFSALTVSAGAIGGAIIGAVSGSVAYATIIPRLGGDNPTPSEGSAQSKIRTVLTNPHNEFEIVGILHNQIINDFFKAFPGTDFDTIFNFVASSHRLYSINTNGLNLNELKKMALENIYKDTITTINGTIAFFGSFCSTNTLSKINFAIQNLSMCPTIDIFNTVINGIEVNLFHDSQICEKEMMYIKIYFSTLKYSANLWQ